MDELPRIDRSFRSKGRNLYAGGDPIDFGGGHRKKEGENGQIPSVFYL